ncbi:MAG: hypothetical protein VW976_00070 [Flavobacteriaceae bacterium]
MTLKNSFLTTLGCWAIVGVFYLSYQLKVTHLLEGVLRELLLLPTFFGGIFFGIYTLVLLIKKLRTKQ